MITFFLYFIENFNQGEGQGPVTAAPYEVSKIIDHAFVDSLSDAEKMQFLEKSWRPPPNSILDKQVINRAGKTVTTKFQTKWLDQRNWLAYSANPLHCGGWCKVCLLFLTTKEKDAALGAFVKSAFKHYSKSKEKLDSHESADYHKKAEERGLYAKTQLQNIANRIDIQLNKVTNQNIKSNKAILPHIANAARLCTVQQIPFRGHRDDKIQYSLRKNLPTMKATLSPSFVY